MSTFQDLKKFLKTPPLLAKPVDGEPLLLFLSVSDTDVSTTLVREKGKIQHPIHYVSCTLLDAETRYPLVEKYPLALIIVERKLKPYFQCHSIIVTTAFPLRAILYKPKTYGRLMKWAVELSQFDITYQNLTPLEEWIL